jgi:hypothetical protein
VAAFESPRSIGESAQGAGRPGHLEAPQRPKEGVAGVRPADNPCGKGAGSDCEGAEGEKVVAHGREDTP